MTPRLTVGETFESVLVDDLTRSQIVQYAGASGDYNPVHTDEVYATQVVGYPTVFAHGMLTMGLTATMVTDLVGDGALTSYGARFVRQVWPGDTLLASAVVDEIVLDGAHQRVRISVTTTNQHGDVVLTATAVARVQD